MWSVARLVGMAPPVPHYQDIEVQMKVLHQQALHIANELRRYHEQFYAAGDAATDASDA